MKTTRRMAANVETRRALLGTAFLVGTVALLLGCAANDPFDPESVENHRPTVGMFVAPPDTGTFPPTSYFRRTFSWHGSDQDGWVTEFDLSIRLEQGTEAPWETTTKTDTSMTFVTDDNGEAEATFYVVARDNRGALSDTLIQFFPLRNFPPDIFFDPEFEPLVNLQREVVDNGTAEADTVFWNWGFSNFKLVASDRDGVSTMDQFYRYTFADVEPTETYPQGDPLADPETTWVEAPFINAGDPTTGFRNFEIDAVDVAVGLRTLTVSIKDEGGSDARFTYSWDVRAPRSNILYIRDNSSSIGRQCYTEFMDGRFGAGDWDTYDFWMGYPDRHTTLTAVMRKYDAVLWTDGGVISDILNKASERGGALEAYVFGGGGQASGKLMMISSVVAGTNSGRLGPNFRFQALGVQQSGAPVSTLTMQAGRQALGEMPGLMPMTSNVSSGRGIGLQVYLNAGVPVSEVLYRMEECIRCYNSRPPFDPVVAVRSPVRSESALARTITISTQLELFNRAEVLAALNHLFDVELGVTTP
jgi:hypothetical protein